MCKWQTDGESFGRSQNKTFRPIRVASEIHRSNKNRNKKVTLGPFLYDVFCLFVLFFSTVSMRKINCCCRGPKTKGVEQDRNQKICYYLITDILTDETLLINLYPLLPIVVLPSEKWETGHEQRNQPNGGNHQRDAANGPLLDVVDTRHRPVSAQQPMHRQ